MAATTAAKTKSPKAKGIAKRKITKKSAKTSTKTGARKKAAKAKRKSPIRQRANFLLNEYIVYPSHGVGQIIEISEQEISGHRLEFFVVEFKQERMLLKVPVKKVADRGMRKLANEKGIKELSLAW